MLHAAGSLTRPSYTLAARGARNLAPRVRERARLPLLLSNDQRKLLLPRACEGARRHPLATAATGRTRRRREASARRRCAARSGDVDASHGRRRRDRSVAAWPVAQVGAAQGVDESDWATPRVVRRRAVGWCAAI